MTFLIVSVTSYLLHRCLIAKRLLIYGTLFLSICFILSLDLAYTNTEEDEEKYFVYATIESDDDTTQDLNEEEEVILKPILKNNSGLKVEEVTDGLDFPTSMAFLGPDDILVLEKNEGTVRRILNGVLLEEPLLDVDVANKGERGMLGIAIANNNNNNNSNSNSGNNSDTPYVFLYYTESEKEGDDDDGKEAKDNRLYRYELENNKLVNPEL